MFEYRDNDGARLAIDAVNASTYYGNEPVVALLTEHRDGDDVPVVYVPLDRVEEVVAGIRDAARQASGQQPDTDEAVVAYRNRHRPSVLLCREHGKGSIDWGGLVPLTADDLPDGGICTWGRPIGPECGRDVLVGVHAQKPAYDAVYAYIRALGDHMPPDPVHRNAMIWRAVHAALDATPVGRCVSSHCVEGNHVLIVEEDENR